MAQGLHSSDSFTIRGARQAVASRVDLRQDLSSASRRLGFVLVTNRYGEPRFPAFCPNCGNPAHQLVRVQRAFEFVLNDDEDQTQNIHAMDEFFIPFCESCALQHYREQQAPGRWAHLQRLFGGNGRGIGALMICAAGIMFFSTGNRHHGLVPVLFACVLWLIGGWMLRSNWKQTDYLTVAQPTSVSDAVDFTPVLSFAHEPSWRAFEFRRTEYAELFRAANAKGLWDMHGAEILAAREERSRESSRSNWVVGVIVLTVVIWMYREQVAEFFGLSLP